MEVFTFPINYFIKLRRRRDGGDCRRWCQQAGDRRRPAENVDDVQRQWVVSETEQRRRGSPWRFRVEGQGQWSDGGWRHQCPAAAQDAEEGCRGLWLEVVTGG